MVRRFILPQVVAGLLSLCGCGSNYNQAPAPAVPGPNMVADAAEGRAGTGRPDYEPAYYNGQIFTINAINVPNHAPLTAQAELYGVVYPIGWENLGLAAPQCNPCDHAGDGVDFTDFHDHVLDSVPQSTGQGEFSPLWHVFFVLPAYNNNPTHDAAVTAAYAARLPATSEEDVEELLDAQLADGSPVAVEVDTDFYFLCAVVSSQAQP